MSLRSRKHETVQQFFNAFYINTMLSQGLLPNMELLNLLTSYLFSAILDTKTIKKVQKRPMTHFNISVVAKRRRDNKKQREWTKCKMQKIFQGPTLYSVKLPHGIV